MHSAGFVMRRSQVRLLFPAPDSAKSPGPGRGFFIADEKVRACALAKTGKESGMTFIGDGRYDAAWSFEYQGQGRLCEVIVGDDGMVEIDPPAQ